MLELSEIEREQLNELVDTLRAELKVDTSVVTYLTGTHQHFLAISGMSLPPVHDGKVALNHTLCTHSTEMNFRLVVDDTYSHPLHRNDRATDAFGVGAYVGAPYHRPDTGRAVGTVCAMRRKPQRWSVEEIRRVVEAAEMLDVWLVEWDMHA